MIRSVSRSRSIRRATLATVIAILALAAAAVAYFTSQASGNGSASTGTVLPVTLSAGTPTTQLFPGGQADVAVTISNPNSFRVHIGSLALQTTSGTGGFSVDGSHSGCGVSSLSFTSQTNGGAGWFVAPKVGSTNGSLSVDLTSAVSMSTNAANACQGASFNVYLMAVS